MPLRASALDLDAPILPGISAAGISLGAELTSFSSIIPVSADTSISSDVLQRNFGIVKVWLRKGIVDQIMVTAGYRGLVQDRVRIGNTIADVELSLGQAVIEDEQDNLVVIGVPGWSFETEEWGGNHTLEENRGARITQIFVFSK